MRKENWYEKRFRVFSLFAFLVIGISLTPLVSQPSVEVEASADFTSDKIVIPVVRPDWWDNPDDPPGNGAKQVLRIANSSSDLEDNTINTTWVEIDEWVGDANAWADGGNGVYANTGVIFYEVSYEFINGKHIDLARFNPNNLNERWNKTPTEIFGPSMLHRIWRIFGDGNGIWRPQGSDAESRGASNAVVAKILSGYTTCSSSSVNGYGAITTLNDHYNLDRIWGDTTVYDFSSINDYATGKGTGIQVPAWEKYQAMLALYNASSGKRYGAEPTNDNSLVATIIIGIIGLTTLAGYYLLQKKKEA